MSLIYRAIDANANRTVVSDDLAGTLDTVAGWYKNPPQEIIKPMEAMKASGQIEQQWANILRDNGVQVELLRLEDAVDGLRSYQRELSVAQDVVDSALQDRNEYILMLRKAGASVASMTEPLGMSRAQVDRIANPKE